MPYFNIVAETNQNTVVTEYEPVKARADSYQSEAALEREQRLQGAMLAVRRRYGANAVFKGMSLREGATGLERNRQIGGHRA